MYIYMHEHEYCICTHTLTVVCMCKRARTQFVEIHHKSMYFLCMLPKVAVEALSFYFEKTVI